MPCNDYINKLTIFAYRNLITKFENMEQTQGLEKIPARYGQTLEQVSLFVADRSALVIAGVEDKAGYESCKTAAKELAQLRLDIESKRKELKQPAITYGAAVDAHAKLITAPILEAETALKNKIKAVDERKAEMKKAAEKQRILKLSAVGFGLAGQFYQRGAVIIPWETVLNCSDAEFDKIISDAEKSIEIERLAEEERKRAESEAEKAKQAAAEAAEKELQELEAKLAAARAEIAKNAAKLEQAASAPVQMPQVTPEPQPAATARTTETQPATTPQNTGKLRPEFAPDELLFRAGFWWARRAIYMFAQNAQTMHEVLEFAKQLTPESCNQQ